MLSNLKCRHLAVLISTVMRPMMRCTPSDILFSINNHQLISGSVLEMLPLGAVNMHQSLLPAYAGLNSCSWMILNGEKEHGVTWHRVTEEIDGGPILAQAKFPVTSNMTALAAMLEVITLGTNLFGPLLSDLRDGVSFNVRQEGKGCYYSAQQIPFEGRFPINEEFLMLERLSRAMTSTIAGNVFNLS